jgi:hypothetical protein
MLRNALGFRCTTIKIQTGLQRKAVCVTEGAHREPHHSTVCATGKMHFHKGSVAEGPQRETHHSTVCVNLKNALSQRFCGREGAHKETHHSTV